MLRAAVVCSLALLVPSLASAVDITGCSQSVPAREIGVLQVDLLSCGSSASAVFLNERSELELNGHTIGSGSIGVNCRGKRCKVRGPGEITGATLHGILASYPNARLLVEDADVHHNGNGGILASSGRPRITVRRVNATNNIVGLETIFKGRIYGEDVDASNNSAGVVAGARFRFERLTLLNSGGNGITCLYGGGRILDSTVTGSGGTDLATHRRPRVVNSTCGTSASYNPALGTWGVCAND